MNEGFFPRTFNILQLSFPKITTPGNNISRQKVSNEPSGRTFQLSNAQPSRVASCKKKKTESEKVWMDPRKKKNTPSFPSTNFLRLSRLRHNPHTWNSRNSQALPEPSRVTTMTQPYLAISQLREWNKTLKPLGVFKLGGMK